MSTDESNDSIGVFGAVSKWLGELGMSTVSLFVFSHRFIIDTLDLELSRYNLDPTVSPSPSNEFNDSVQRFRIICGSLCCTSALQVGLSTVLRLVDFCRCGFQSSASLSMPNRSKRMLCVLDGWLRRHR